MATNMWRTAAVVLGVGGLLAGATAQSGEKSAAPVVRANDSYECYDDECDDCRPRCCGLCYNLKLHCTYFWRKTTRPYVRIGYPPPELAPYINNGTYYNGYGSPAFFGQGPAAYANGNCYGPQPR